MDRPEIDLVEAVGKPFAAFLRGPEAAALTRAFLTAAEQMGRHLAPLAAEMRKAGLVYREGTTPRDVTKMLALVLDENLTSLDGVLGLNWGDYEHLDLEIEDGDGSVGWFRVTVERVRK